MTAGVQTAESIALPLLVPTGEDRFVEHKHLGVSDIAFKMTSQESKDLFMVEVTLRQKGGPARHVHYYQDEWFYVLEGELVIEAGDGRFQLKPGDSLFVPRKTPHVWAFIRDTGGKFLASVSPAGNLEEFFNNASKYNALPGQDQTQWQPYGLEWLGPPLQV